MSFSVLPAFSHFRLPDDIIPPCLVSTSLPTELEWGLPPPDDVIDWPSLPLPVPPLPIPTRRLMIFMTAADDETREGDDADRDGAEWESDVRYR